MMGYRNSAAHARGAAVTGTPCRRSGWLAAVMCAWGLVWPQLASAQIAHVLRIDGAAMLERAGQLRRILGVGEQLGEKDVISVAGDSHVMLEFRDQTRITLRPNTIFRVDAYQDLKSESMLLGLVRGGLRAVTGLIARRTPTAVQFQTTTTTIGIRGTEFDARLCDDDCAVEDRARPAPRARLDVVARVVENGGLAAAGFAAQPARIVLPGALIYAGEAVATAPDAYVVLAFPDGSRATLSADTALILERFRYDQARPEQSLAALRLSHGGLRMMSGDIAKSGGASFVVETALGRLQVRGTLFDAVCTGACDDPRGGIRDEVVRLRQQIEKAAAAANSEADQAGGAGKPPPGSAALGAKPPQPLPAAGLVVHAIEGVVAVEAGSTKAELRSGEAIAVADRDTAPTSLSPPRYLLENRAPRPDRVLVDAGTFGAPQGNVEPGLYVWVRDGAILLAQSAAPRASAEPRFIRTALGGAPPVLEVTAGNAAVATRDTIRPLPAVPNFMRFDPTPLPTRTNLGYVPPAFRAPDRSVTSTCAP